MRNHDFLKVNIRYFTLRVIDELNILQNNKNSDAIIDFICETSGGSGVREWKRHHRKNLLLL